jgi:hypothetical protein
MEGVVVEVECGCRHCCYYQAGFLYIPCQVHGYNRETIPKRINRNRDRRMFKYIRYTISTLWALLLLVGCSSEESIIGTVATTLSPTATTLKPTTTTVPASPTNYLINPYLGQKPPGMEPEIFAPGLISDPNSSEYSGSFSADGTEYYFNRFSGNSESKFLYSKLEDGRWTIPEQLAITTGYAASEAHVTLDNTQLYFLWRKPVPEGQPGFPSYYVSKRIPDGWSEPTYSGQGMFLSSSKDGELYTTDMSERMKTGRTYLAQVIVVNDLFVKYERLAIQVPFGYPAHPCIAPDGSFLLFDVLSGNYLFASFKQADGSWGDPINLTKHGFDPQAGGAYVSPDGKYLFFALNEDIWWVDIQVIESLRPKQ